MNLEDTGVYPFIKDYPECRTLYRFKKGECITRAASSNENYWYLVDGEVEVVTTSHRGKLIHVDENVEDEFTGHLSKYWGEDFFCDCIAVTPCTLIRIPNQLFDQLMKRDDFKAFFCFKASSRLYAMHRNYLSKEIFSPRQRFAAMIIENMKYGASSFPNLSKVCDNVGVSRRNLYNIINEFSEEGLISYEYTGIVEVLDERRLHEIGAPVLGYFEY